MIIAKKVEVIQKNDLVIEYSAVTQVYPIGNQLTVCGRYGSSPELVVDKYFLVDLKRLIVEFEVKE